MTPVHEQLSGPAPLERHAATVTPNPNPHNKAEMIVAYSLTQFSLKGPMP